jgi:alkyl hydroperoxide reductase subunit AhpC
MSTLNQRWNPWQKELSRLLKAPDDFDAAMLLCLRMHNEVHDLGKQSSPTIFQSLLDGLAAEAIGYRPEKSFSSIAWNIWHITRIEDAIANIFIADSDQVLNKEWLDRMNVRITDTGNAFTKEDVDAIDGRVNAKELLNYRKAVGKNTQKVLKSIRAVDKKRKATPEQLKRIVSEKVLTKEPDSIWLLDFWKGKTVAGLLTMPITRHQIVHINDCFKLKERYQKNAAR